MSELVRVKGLEFSYKASSPVIKIESFEMNSSERVFLYGPSGCGKSTLLNLIAGTLAASKGQTLVCGKDMTKLSASKRDHHRGEKLGYIFQSFNLISYLTILENVMLPIIVTPKKSNKGEAQEQAEQFLEALGLLEFKDQLASNLSVGQRQRVAAARALMGKPELIIADEPTSSLDEKNTEEFMQLLLNESAKRKIGLLFVSHDLRLSDKFDRSVELPSINQIGKA